MNTQKSMKIRNPLEYCDICGSEEIIETTAGFCCRECGIVLEIQKLEYFKPYNEKKEQYEILGKTTIGFKTERRTMKNAIHIEKLSLLDSIRTNEENVNTRAKVEIKRILTGLKLPLNKTNVIFRKFTEIREKLGKGTKFRSPSKLVPCIIYFHSKQNYYPIQEDELLEISDISKKDFNTFKLQLLEMWPQYQERNRKEYILQRILFITEHFNLGMSFYYQSKKLLYRFYDSIKNTKDDVIAGLMVSITLLCSQNEDIKINMICNCLNITMSSIQSQIKRRIIERFNISGFKSLVKSADILKDIMLRLGVLNSKYKGKEDKQIKIAPKSVSDIVQVTLGSASPVFCQNYNELLENYLFVKDNNGHIITIIIKQRVILNNNPYNMLRKQRILNKFSNISVNLEHWKFHYPTGPPMEAI